jgi:hypothetical protein
MLVQRTAFALCIAVYSIVPACSRSVPVEVAKLADAVQATPIVLEVENHNWADIVLYVVHDGVHTRFAQVAATHNVSMKIPPQLHGQMGVIRIAARRIGGTDSFVSQAISLRGNASVRFTIESNLARSSVGVW